MAGREPSGQGPRCREDRVRAACTAATAAAVWAPGRQRPASRRPPRLRPAPPGPGPAPPGPGPAPPGPGPAPPGSPDTLTSSPHALPTPSRPTTTLRPGAAHSASATQGRGPVASPLPLLLSGNGNVQISGSREISKCPRSAWSPGETARPKQAQASPGRAPPPGPPSCAHRGPRAGDGSLQPGTRGAGVAPDRGCSGTSPPERKRDQVGQRGGTGSGRHGTRAGARRAHVGPGCGSGRVHCAGRAAGTGLSRPGSRTRPSLAPPASAGASPATESSLPKPLATAPAGSRAGRLSWSRRSPLYGHRDASGGSRAPLRGGLGGPGGKTKRKPRGALRVPGPRACPGRGKTKPTARAETGASRSLDVLSPRHRQSRALEAPAQPRAQGEGKGPPGPGSGTPPPPPARAPPPLPRPQVPAAPAASVTRRGAARRVLRRGTLLGQLALPRERLRFCGVWLPETQTWTRDPAERSGTPSCGKEPGPFSHHVHAALRRVGTCKEAPEDPIHPPTHQRCGPKASATQAHHITQEGQQLLDPTHICWLS
ncbi:collagen alpha-1(I) chain-like [Elephas maximus indicus]|uniref:collagen alpha-1(I) chain-like n=1 Tax=Elephas maximus indicus TaxID=99487 RepID=UPI002116D394|nr:collagen alpha-1(I) chain-like [Elephas maximus indicus]